MANLVHKQFFVGGLTSDTHPKNIKEGDYLYMQNMRNTKTSGNEYGGATNVRGNIKVDFDLPSGDNYVIGRLEDKQKQRIFYWVHNSNNNHSLLTYNVLTNEVYYVLLGSYLGLRKEWRVTQPSIIDGKIVQWGETRVNGVEVQGSPPRYVDTNRAILTDKYCQFNIICNTLGNENNSVASYWIEVTENGVATNYILGQINSLDKSEIYTELHNKIMSNADLQNIIESVDCGGCKLEIKSKKKGDVWVSIGSTNYSFFTLPKNRYHKDLDETSIKLGRLVPTYEPKIEMIQDEEFQYNYVYNTYMQFATRYVYWDGQKSTFSDFSTVANVPVGCNGEEDTYNAIVVDFTDELLNNELRLADIERVEIGARNGNSGSFSLVAKIEVCELDFPNQTFTYRNDGQYSQVSDEESYRSYSHIPLLATSHLVVDDRSFWGGTLERYDNIPCVEASADVEYEELKSDCKTEYVTIKGRVRIFNRMSDRDGSNLGIFDNQAIWRKDGEDYYFGGFNNRTGLDTEPSTSKAQTFKQQIPLGGFTAYLAGTGYYATSVQKTAGGGVVADENNVYYARNNDEADEIIEFGADNGIWSDFEIKNVPKGGKYVLRLASHLLREDDTIGTVYNINKGLEWQKTSTYIRGVLDVDSGGLYATSEIVVDTNVIEDEIDLTGQQFLINDLVSTGKVNNTSAGCALYVIDGIPNDISNTIESVKLGLQVEGALISQSIVGDDLAISPNKRADHNGFFYMSGGSKTKYNFPVSTIRLLGFSINTITIKGLPLWIKEQQLYENNWFNLKGGETPIPINEIQYNSLNSTTSIFREYTVYNHYKETTDNTLFKVVGRVIDSTTNNGISGVSIVATNTSRIGVTDVFGNYSILLYAYQVIGYTLNLYLVDDNECCPTLITKEYTANIVLIVRYSVDKPYNVPDFIGEVSDTSLGFWKRRNKLKFGIIYQDEYNRQTKVQTADTLEVYIPFWTENGGLVGQPIINWEINHKPPIWATKYQIVRTLNSIYSRYLQFIISSPKYVIGYEDGTVVETSYSSRQATEVYIPLSSIILYNEDNWGSVLGWDIQSGDRVTFMRDGEGEWYDGYYDYRVQNDKVKTIEDVTYLVIKFDQSQPEITAGSMIELYSLKKEATLDLFYMMSETYPILNAKTDQRVHAMGYNGRNQTSTQSATGQLVLGDSYEQKRKMSYTDGDDKKQSVSYDFESMFMNEFIVESMVQQIGRLLSEDKNYGQVFYYTRLRHTGRYLPDTNVNLLNQSAELEYIRDDNSTEIDRQFGVLTSLQYAGSLILAILQFKCVPVYTNATPVFDLKGGSVLTKSNSIAIIAQPIREDKGCQNPESISCDNGNIYAFDRQKTAWWRYGFNGLYDISDYEMHSEFSSIAKELSPADIVLSCFDRENSELITMFPSQNKIISFNETLAGDVKKNRWMTQYTFKMPDHMAIQGDLLVSFLNGELWLHDKGEYGNFYGEQLECGVDFVVNNEPDVKKLFWHIRVKSTDAVYTPPKGIEVYIDQSISPMVSELRENHFERLEGDYWADFRRNMVDKEFDNIEPIELREVTALLKGMPLRGDYMIIKLRNKSNKKVTLYSVDTYSSISNKTN